MSIARKHVIAASVLVHFLKLFTRLQHCVSCICQAASSRERCSDRSNVYLHLQAFKAHPDKPSQARCDELAQAWHDPYSPQAPERYNPLPTGPMLKNLCRILNSVQGASLMPTYHGVQNNRLLASVSKYLQDAASCSLLAGSIHASAAEH